MKKLKEPEIKLFGRKIVLPENGGVVAAGEESSDETNNGSRGGGGDCDRCLKVSGGGEGEGEKSDDEKQPPLDEEAQETETSETKQQERDQNPNSSPELDSNPKNPPTDEDVVSENNPKTQENEPTDKQQMTLTKPDKILPCPRCNSMDTKFCYYNNYNVNQPRHFCKSCQRYWTAGGTMRKVPVGAGRRKNKNSTSHITISEAFHAAQAVDPPNGLHHPSFKPNNGTILSFRPDSPLCDSMASALDLAYKRAQNGYHKNGENTNDSSVHTPNHRPEGGENRPEKPVINNTNGFPVPLPVTCVPGENELEKPVINNPNVFAFPVPCVPGISWNYPWNPAVPLLAICPIPFYPTPYWNYNVLNSWDFPWLTAQSPTADQTAIASSGPGSPLGKHSRNGELIKPNRSENKEQLELRNSESSIVVVPKTLRIDDPEEAAKSSIWETLGIKYDSISRECLFKALQLKSSEGKHKISASPVLQANPAAVFRSISFQEGH